MPVSDSHYAEWMLDVERDNHRVILVDFGHAGDSSGSAHGRTDALASLVGPASMTVRSFTPSDGEVEFEPAPDSPPGTQWEVWVNGARRATIASAPWSVSFRATPNTDIVALVVGVNESEEYSQPWAATLHFDQSQGSVRGSRSPWSHHGVPAGALRISSRPYLDTTTGYHYDNWLRGEFLIEHRLDGFGGVGDIEAICPDPAVDWKSIEFSGHSCTVRHGDEAWKFEDFRPIASVVTRACRPIGGNEYQFDLTDGGRRFRRGFHKSENDYIAAGSATSVINLIMRDAGLPKPSYTNIPNSKNFVVRVSYPASAKVDDAVREIARSIGAEIRVRSNGLLEIFRADLTSPVITVTSADTIARTVSCVDTTPAYTRVVVVMAPSDGENGESIRIERERATGADTGELDRVLRVETLLTDVAQADELVDELVDKHRTTRRAWGLELFRSVGRAQIGDVIRIDHPSVSGVGICTRLLSSPLEQSSPIEVQL